MRRRVRQARTAVLRTAHLLMTTKIRGPALEPWLRLARAWLLEVATDPSSDRAQVIALHMLEAGRECCVFAPCVTCGAELQSVKVVDQGPCLRHAPSAFDGPAWALARYTASALAFAATLHPEDVDPEVRADVRRALEELEERLEAARKEDR